MRRVLFDLSAVASVGVCIAAVIISVRTYARPVRYENRHRWITQTRSMSSRALSAESNSGGLELSLHIGDTGPPPIFNGHKFEYHAFNGTTWTTPKREYPTFALPLPASSYQFAAGHSFISYERWGFGFAYRVADDADGSWTRDVACFFPFGAVEALLMMIPLRCAAVNVQRRKRRRSGLCLFCGYDIRASPDRCPECGTQIKGDRI